MKKLLVAGVLIFLFQFSWATTLKITEIFFDGYSEWIEITALDWSYSGQIILSWFKNSQIIISNFQISTGESIVLLEEWKDYNYISSWVKTFLVDGFSITDTAEIKFSLIYSWGIDTGFILSDLVNNLNNKNTSLELLLSWNQFFWIGTSQDHIYGIVSGSYIANPWKVFFDLSAFLSTNSTSDFNFNSDSGSFSTSNEFVSCGIEYSLTSSVVLSYTGNIDNIDTNITRELNWVLFWSGQEVDIDLSKLSTSNEFVMKVFSGDSLICQSKLIYYQTTKTVVDTVTQIIYKDSLTFNGKLYITEIHPFDDSLPEYIELYASWGHFSWNVEIIWLWRWSASKTFDIFLQSGQYLVITDSTWLNISNKLIIPSISLTDWWEELTLVYSWIQTKYSYIEWEKWKALYFSRFSGDTALFENQNYPTPWFNHDLLNLYFTSSDSTDFHTFCEIKIQNTDPIVYWKKVNFIAVYSGKLLYNTNTKFVCQWNIDWQVIDKCNPDYIGFDSPGLKDIYLQIKSLEDGKICKVKTQFNYPPIVSFSCGSCKELYYKDLYNKRKWKYYDLSKKYKKLQNQNDILNQSLNPDLQILTWILKIDYILPNPKWKDTGNEKIVIKNLTQQKLNLSGFYLNYRKRKYYLSGDLLPEQVKVLKWDFRFPNKGSCVFLKKDNTIYDFICYLDAKSDQKFTSEEDNFTQYFNLSILSTLEKIQFSLKHYNDKVCIEVDNLDKQVDNVVNFTQFVNMWDFSWSLQKLNLTLNNIDKQVDNLDNYVDKSWDKIKICSSLKYTKADIDALKAENKKLKAKLKLLVKYYKKLYKRYQKLKKENFKLRVKIVSLQTKLHKQHLKYQDLNQRYKNYRNKKASSVANYRAQIEKLKAKSKKYRQEIKLLKEKIKLLENYVKFVKSKFKGDWKLVWKKLELDKAYKLLDYLLEQESPQILINGGQYKLSDFNQLFQLYSFWLINTK